MGYVGMKPQQHCPGVPQQVMWFWVCGPAGTGQHGQSGWAAAQLSSPPASILGCWAKLSLGTAHLLNSEQESYLDSDVIFLLLFLSSSRMTPPAC